MNQREKILAGVVGLLVLGVGINALVANVMGRFEARRTRIAELTEQVDRLENRMRRGRRARRDLDVYEARSLPSELANSRYRAWLHEWVEDAGITQQDVRLVSARRRGDHYAAYTFGVSCNGSLDQLTELLYAFYSADVLHRIKRMTLKRRESDLAMAFTIEAVAMPHADPTKEITSETSRRLAFPNLAAYQDVLLTRDFYQPANEPPRFDRLRDATAYVNQPFRMTARARDPENQPLRYQMNGELPGAEFDERTGELRWTPTEKGSFAVALVVEDSKSGRDETRLEIQVTDPPPQPDPPRPPVFDRAKFTFLTAVVEVNGQWQAWLSNRTEGKVLKLIEGDEFQIGEFTGTIQHIDRLNVEILAGGVVMQVRIGQPLSDAQPLSRASR